MLKDFKPVLMILLRFALIYLALFLLYQLYLNRTEPFGLDPYSRWVAEHVKTLQNAAGYSTVLQHFPKQITEYFKINNNYVSRMVEGCNAVSVMILFAAFVLAFYKGAKTFLFVVGSIVFLHVMNVLRIAGLNIVLTEYPQFGKITHDYLFPAVIYGLVVLLWLIWINKFVLKK